jgi:hypothetical protein
MAETDDTKIARMGPLVYQVWGTGATSADTTPLVMTLNVTRGVVRATRFEVPGGMCVAVIINTEFDIPTVIGRVKREAVGWASRHGITIVDDAGQPVFQPEPN